MPSSSTIPLLVFVLGSLCCIEITLKFIICILHGFILHVFTQLEIGTEAFKEFEEEEDFLQLTAKLSDNWMNNFINRLLS